MHPGQSTYITYTVTMADNTVVDASATWKSSNTSVAKVSSKGKVVAVGAGKCKITCTAKKISKTVNIIVKPKKVKSLKTLSKSKNSIQLKWARQKGVSKYQVYMYDNDLEEYVKVKTVKGSLNSARITGLRKGKYYRFKVRAFVTDGSKKYYGSFSKVYRVKTKTR